MFCEVRKVFVVVLRRVRHNQHGNLGKKPLKDGCVRDGRDVRIRVMVRCQHDGCNGELSVMSGFKCREGIGENSERIMRDDDEGKAAVFCQVGGCFMLGDGN